VLFVRSLQGAGSTHWPHIQIEGVQQGQRSRTPRQAHASEPRSTCHASRSHLRCCCCQAKPKASWRHPAAHCWCLVVHSCCCCCCAVLCCAAAVATDVQAVAGLPPVLLLPPSDCCRPQHPGGTAGACGTCRTSLSVCWGRTFGYLHTLVSKEPSRSPVTAQVMSDQYVQSLHSEQNGGHKRSMCVST
jgi:hypothetical protein